MAYALGASWYDPLVSAASGGASSIGQQAAAGAVPELKAAVVGAIRDVLPDVKSALSSALSTGVSDITKKNRAAFIGFGVVIGLFTVGSLGLMYAQYRRQGKCCPVR